LKPYYVETRNDANETKRLTFQQLVNDSANSRYYLTGSSGFTVGWDHLSVKPGLNAKTAMRFDYGRLNQTITAIEAGLTGEFYFSKIPLVMQVPQKQFFFNAYVAILFGSRK
jgi:hypothetical protein